MARVVVDVMPKPEILDPQGKAVQGALPRLGFEGVSEVRQGKRFELELDGEATEERLAQVHKMATMLLSLENYPQAIAAFDKLESLGDASPGVYFLRALAFDKMQNYKAALPNYQKFLAASGNKFPDEEFKARQRLKVIEKELARR